MSRVVFALAWIVSLQYTTISSIVGSTSFYRVFVIRGMSLSLSVSSLILAFFFGFILLEPLSASLSGRALESRIFGLLRGYLGEEEISSSLSLLFLVIYTALRANSCNLAFLIQVIQAFRPLGYSSRSNQILGYLSGLPTILQKSLKSLEVRAQSFSSLLQIRRYMGYDDGIPLAIASEDIVVLIASSIQSFRDILQ